MQVLAIIIAGIAIIAALYMVIMGNIITALITLIPYLAIAGVLYSLGEIASDIRDINNILRVVHADKLAEAENDTDKDWDFSDSDLLIQCPGCNTVHDRELSQCPQCNHKY